MSESLPFSWNQRAKEHKEATDYFFVSDVSCRLIRVDTVVRNIPVKKKFALEVGWVDLSSTPRHEAKQQFSQLQFCLGSQANFEKKFFLQKIQHSGTDFRAKQTQASDFKSAFTSMVKFGFAEPSHCVPFLVKTHTTFSLLILPSPAVGRQDGFP